MIGHCPQACLQRAQIPGNLVINPECYWGLEEHQAISYLIVVLHVHKSIIRRLILKCWLKHHPNVIPFHVTTVSWTSDKWDSIMIIRIVYDVRCVILRTIRKHCRIVKGTICWVALGNIRVAPLKYHSSIDFTQKSRH